MRRESADTRTTGAHVRPPALAIAELLSFLGHTESSIEAVGVVRDPEQPDWHPESSGVIEIDAPRAHADYAFQASGFDSALVVVCDATAARGYSAWNYQGPPVRSQDSVGDFPIAEVYGALTEAWGEMSGVPALVNTSFNGFHEPLVCAPRDAVRVFYGTGLDMLAIEGFVLRK